MHLLLRGGALVLGLSLAQCGHPPAANPSRPPCCRFDTAYDLMPSDVDVVVRLDWSQLRTSPLYDVALHSFSERAGGSPLSSVLDGARTVLLGLRVMPDGIQGDGVIVIESDRAELTDSQLEEMLGGRSVERSAIGADGSRMAVRRGRLTRLDRALVWVIEGKAIVIATTAEADAVERLARGGPDKQPVDVPARGLLSFAVRAPSGGEWTRTLREPMRAIASDLLNMRGAFDLTAGERVRLEAELGYHSDQSAAAAAERLRTTLKRLSALGGEVGAAVREIERQARIVSDHRTVAVVATFPLAWLDAPRSGAPQSGAPQSRQTPP